MDNSELAFISENILPYIHSTIISNYDDKYEIKHCTILAKACKNLITMIGIEVSRNLLILKCGNLIISKIIKTIEKSLSVDTFNVQISLMMNLIDNYSVTLNENGLNMNGLNMNGLNMNELNANETIRLNDSINPLYRELSTIKQSLENISNNEEIGYGKLTIRNSLKNILNNIKHAIDSSIINPKIINNIDDMIIYLDEISEELDILYDGSWIKSIFDLYVLRYQHMYVSREFNKLIDWLYFNAKLEDMDFYDDNRLHKIILNELLKYFKTVIVKTDSSISELNIEKIISVNISDDVIYRLSLIVISAINSIIEKTFMLQLVSKKNDSINKISIQQSIISIISTLPKLTQKQILLVKEYIVSNGCNKQQSKTKDINIQQEKTQKTTQKTTNRITKKPTRNKNISTKKETIENKSVKCASNHRSESSDNGSESSEYATYEHVSNERMSTEYVSDEHASDEYVSDRND